MRAHVKSEHGIDYSAGGFRELGIPLLRGRGFTAADRLGVEDQLTDRIRSAEAQTAAKRARLAERQVYAVAAQLSRYVDYLDFEMVGRNSGVRENDVIIISPANPGESLYYWVVPIQTRGLDFEYQLIHWIRSRNFCISGRVEL